jgi:GDP-4-dehydro-6-deoxy-D-mannose reductase
MRTLVTGITGFVGGHLTETLRTAGIGPIHGIVRQPAWPAEWRHLAGAATLHAGDVTDTDRVEGILRATEPEWIVHLAGYAHVGRSFQEPRQAWADNLTATLSLFEAVTRWGGKPRILFVSTGLIYADPPAGRDCDESCMLAPASPYAASKAAADLAAYQVTRHPGLDVVRARPFNHIGPRQSPMFAASSFARQLAAIEAGSQPPVLETGDLSAFRDLTDVRDVGNAYVLLLQKGRSGEAYNVGSGEAVRMSDLLDRLVRLTRVRVDVRTRADALRPAENAVTRADCAKLVRETGWQRRYPLDRTLADLLDDWRGAARAGRLSA